MLVKNIIIVLLAITCGSILLYRAHLEDKTYKLMETQESWSVSKLNGTYYVAGDKCLREGDTYEEALTNYKLNCL